jgi:cation diffusion facilitator family transporter
VAVEAALFDSLKDVFISCVNLMLVLKSTKSADEKYQFGYGKLEAFASLIQAILLITMSVLLTYELFSSDHSVDYSSVATWNLLLSLTLIICVACAQGFYAKKMKSSALLADAAHYKADVVTNFMIIVGFLTSQKIRWLDATIGISISIYFLMIAFSVGKRALNTLLDKALPAEVIRKVEELVISCGIAPPISIATKHLGRSEFFLVQRLFSKSESTEDFANKQKIVEAVIHEAFPTAYVIIKPNFDTPS